MMPLACSDLSVTLKSRTILSDIGLSVGQGEVLGLLGPNGAGKTTLLKALAGLLASSGEVAVQGKPLGEYAPQERARAIAYLPQSAAAHWAMPVHAVVALGRLPHQGLGMPLTDLDLREIERSMQDSDIADLRDRPVTSLSGGERARVLLARALAVAAPILLADEPVAFLDPRHQLGVMEVLSNRAASGTACMVVLHDLALAARYCHRVAVLDRGRMIAIGNPHDVMTSDLLNAVFQIRAVEGRSMSLPWEISPR